MKPIAALLIFFCTFHYSTCQEPTSPLIFIYDASGSMWGQIQGKTKMEIASSVLQQSVNNLSSMQQIGLIAYGHRREGDCKDVEFLVPADNLSKIKISQSLASIKPLGKTPLAYSALQVIEYLKSSDTKATVILITDGIESCGGDLCQVIQEARAQGIGIKLHIIGFGLKENETEALRCAARAGDGQYYDAGDSPKLAEVLNQATAITVDEPPDNLTVYATKNGRPIDTWVRAYKNGDAQLFKSMRTYGDTAGIYLPPGNYHLEVKPLQGSDVVAITITDVKTSDQEVTHRDVSFDSGTLEVSTTNNGEGWDAVVNIFIHGTTTKAANGRTYGRLDQYDLNPGIYDVKLSPLKLKGDNIIYLMEGVEIVANETQRIEHNFKSGIAKIGASSADGLVDAVVNIAATGTSKRIDGGRTYTSAKNNPREFLLSPGTYTVTLTALGNHKGKKDSFNIEVKENQTIEKVVIF